MDKSKARGLLLSSSKCPETNITVNNVELVVRQPTVGQRDIFVKKSTHEDVLNHRKMAFYAIVDCVRLKGSDEPLFEEADYDTFMNQPIGGVFDELTDAVLNVLSTSKEDIEKK